MALAKGVFAYNNGLDKKFDDGVRMRGRTWQATIKMRSWATIRKRRIFLALVVVVLLYLFIKNMPTGVPPAGLRIDPLTGLSQGRMPVPLRPNSPGKSSDTISKGDIYDGPVRFYRLASTLRDQQNGYEKDNVAVVLHDLRSTTSLIGLACSIALRGRVNVHIVLVCPHEDPIEEIAAISGIDEQECPIFWHDGRPDYNSQSSPGRRDIAVQAAVGHVRAYLRPVTFIIDEHHAQNRRFVNALKSRLNEMWTPLSIVPNDALSSMHWITALDARGLSFLNQIQIDIVITPYEHSSGSLIRLLESIQSAQYIGLLVPRIMIEIPSDIDDFALSYLESFRWPFDSHVGPNKLILYRSLAAGKRSALTSLRTLELFYPSTTSMSHVLVLNPNVELSPEYLHYLYYLTLEYKYGTHGENLTHALMGISLDHRATGSLSANFVGSSSQDNKKSDFFVLSQSLESSAMLFYGDKWVEMQDYVSLRLEHDPSLSIRMPENLENGPATMLNTPTWLVLATEFMRAQNYFTLYSRYSSNKDRMMVIVHTESYQIPPEFSLPKPPDGMYSISTPSMGDDTVLSAQSIVDTSQSAAHQPQNPPSASFSRMGSDVLPDGKDIRLLTHELKNTDWTTSHTEAADYADQLRLTIGGCTNRDDRNEEKLTKSAIEALFCDLAHFK